jgi:transposase InsO family protein
VRIMASFEGEGPKVVDKFDGVNFHLWKFKMEMVMAEKELWEIVEGSEEPPFSSTDPRIMQAYTRREKKAFAILALNLADSQLAHIRSCKTPAEAWSKLCNIHEAKTLANILFLRRKFFTIKMGEEDDMLAHINKVKALADQLNGCDVSVTDGDIVMTLLESLPSSYEYLIVAMESRPITELTLDYVTSRLLHELSRRKENESREDGAALVAKQSKNGGGGSSSDKVCFYCGKKGHIAKFCFKRKRDEKGESANNTKTRDDDEYAFTARYEASMSDGIEGDASMSDGIEGDASMSDWIEVGDEYANMASNVSCNGSTSDWIVDSGATSHMSPHKTCFHSYALINPRRVILGDDTVLEAVGKGQIVVDTEVRGRVKTITIQDVLHVPKLTANLLSVRQLVAKHLRVEFSDKGCYVLSPSRDEVAIIEEHEGLYHIKFSKVHSKESAALAHSNLKDDKLALWHRRLGHLNIKSVKTLRGMVSGMDLHQLKVDASTFTCEGCIEGKQQRLPFAGEGATRATKVLEIVHSDVCGPMKTTSMGGCKYFVTFIDDFSRKIWLYPIKAKSECFEKFKEFKTLVENQSELKIKVFRSDNGGEYMSKKFDELLKNEGIARQTSAPYTPQQNGVAERANRTIVEMARSMLHAQNLKLDLWAEAVVNAVYTRNRCPTSAVEGMTPEQAWSGRQPCVAHMRIFGCIAYAKVPDERRTKLEAKALKCVFLGYCEGTKAYRLMSVDTRKIIRSRDVTFCEESTMEAPLEVGPSGSSGDVLVDTPSKSPSVVDVGDDDGDDEAGDTEVVEAPSSSKAKNGAKGTQEEQVSSSERRYPERSRKPPGEWWKNHIFPQVEDEHANVALSDGPLTIREAMQGEDAVKWERAMQEEYDSLIANGTWQLTPIPKDRNPIGCKWVFRTKRDVSGIVVRHKARLVAKGFAQVHGVDFHETFAPVAKFTTIRCILAIGAALDLEMHQMDVKTAFLNGDLEEDIYMVQPEGFVQQGNEHLVCKLQKSLYGLKQSPRAWYQKIDTFLLAHGFTRSIADHSLYFMQEGQHVVIVIIYVDDLIILASLMSLMNALKGMLEREYEMSDLGELHFCLGVEFVRDRATRTITMSQGKYVMDVLKRFGMEDCKPVATPLDANSKLVKLSEEEYAMEAKSMAEVPYKQAVGSLMYAMIATRPDLAYPISVVSQHMARPGSMHWMTVKRIMRYLRGTSDVKLCLGGKDIVLSGYCDADYAGDTSDRRSTTGYMFKVGSGAVSWNSKRQQTTATSTVEAEYMATSHATKEAIWLRQLMVDVGCTQGEATTIMCDNQGCISLAKNPTHHSRTKHIDVQYHFIREKLELGVIHLEYCPTEHMVADVLTKGLCRDRHQRLVIAFGLRGFGSTQSGSIEVIDAT